MVFILWIKMNYNGKNLVWENRDRFILFVGYGLMFEYLLLYLFGYGLIVEDIKNFR